MAHFAELDNDGNVVNVVVVNNAELIQDGVESEGRGVAFLHSLFGHERWKQTSYNNNFRKNYASIGFRYDNQRDAFVPPKPFQSWILDAETCRWVAPVARPAGDELYDWDEETVSWIPRGAAS